MPAGGQGRRLAAAARRRRGRQSRRAVRLPKVADLPVVRWPQTAGVRWRSLRPRGRRLVAGGAGAVVVLAAALLTWALVGGGQPPRARQYLSFTACLLTGPAGLADARVKPVWAGMQDASLATRAQVEYLPVPGGSTESAALPYLASLVQRRCRVVIAVGGAQVAAVAADASRYPHVEFVVVGAQVSGRNVSVVDGTPSAVRSSVSRVVSAAVAASG